MFKPTAQQNDVFNFIKNQVGHLAIVARAGCGKTSTILLCVDVIRSKFPNAQTLVCAYNKAIATEVSEKLIANGHNDWRKVQSATLHSVGMNLIKSVFPNITVETNKINNLLAQIENPITDQYSSQIIALVRYAKQAGVGFFDDLPISSREVWYALADHFDINGVDDTTEMEGIVDQAIVLYRASLNQTDVIDFDDMILFPLIKNIVVKYTKDFIFLDEAQDLSRARQALARKFIKPRTGRMVVVGDDRQAIYGFSGADAAALPNLVETLGAQVLPLSVTWRCPKAVVSEAQNFVPDISAASTAKDGVVKHIEISKKKMPEWIADLRPTDAVLCRNMAPLVQTAYQIIKSGKACRVEGRAIGEGLEELMKRWKVTTIDQFLKKLDSYEDREVQKAKAKGNDAKVEAVQDKVTTIREICQAVLLEGKTNIDDAVQFVRRLFADGATNCVVLATYHRSKGREWHRVFLWEHSRLCPSRAARQQWQLQQEDNLAYVAITRAKEELVYVSL